MQRDEIRDMIFETDLSATPEFSIDGPWAHKGLKELETDVYIFQQGTGAKLKIGKVSVKIGGAMKFEVELDEEYKDLDVAASFEVPMRFHIRRKK
jgi:hypothetical protein